MAQMAKRGVDARFLKLEDGRRSRRQDEAEDAVKNGVESDLAKKISEAHQGQQAQGVGIDPGRRGARHRTKKDDLQPRSSWCAAGSPKCAQVRQLPRLGPQAFRPAAIEPSAVAERSAGRPGISLRSFPPAAPQAGEVGVQLSRAAFQRSRSSRASSRCGTAGRGGGHDHVGWLAHQWGPVRILSPPADAEGVAVPLEGGEAREIAAEPLPRGRGVLDAHRVPDLLTDSSSPAAQRARHELPRRGSGRSSAPRARPLPHQVQHRLRPRQLVVGAHRPPKRASPENASLAPGTGSPSYELQELPGHPVAVEDWQNGRPSVSEKRKTATGHDAQRSLHRCCSSRPRSRPLPSRIDVNGIGLFPGKR